MPEQLDLTVSISQVDISNWVIVSICLDRETPSIKIIVRSNAKKTKTVLYVPDPQDPAVKDTIRAGLSFINQGKFMTVQGISLQRWLLEKLRDDGHLGAGNVIGNPD